MSYLKQKKHNYRKTVFFNIVSITMLLLSFILFANPLITFLQLNLFHFYCLTWFLFIASVITKKIIPSSILCIALIIFYTLISISGNIFISENYHGKHSIEIEYKPSKKLENTILKGFLILGKDVFASYYLVNAQAPITIIYTNFENFDTKKHPILLNELHKFINKQTANVIVMGNFAMPSWSPLFRKFTEDTGLKVKNKFIFNSFFSVPHFYILGFNNIGINQLKIKDATISAQISYDVTTPLNK